MELPDEEELVIGDDPATTASGSPRDVALLQDIAARMLLERDHMLGFPVNLDFDYRDFALFLGIHANNAGSPYDEGLYHLHTKPFERAVVTFFARLAGFPEAFESGADSVAISGHKMIGGGEHIDRLCADLRT
ncbi:hypothetical protein ACWDSJ_09885 [Nocardia sp. NPDC003482]